MKRSIFFGFAALIGILGSLGIANKVFANSSHTHYTHHEVCPHGKGKGKVRCLARVAVSDSSVIPLAFGIPNGYGPQDFLKAYNLGNGKSFQNTTIAIIDAYGAPNVFSDVNTFSSTFGILQLKSCSVSLGNPSNPCFQKVDQNGGKKYPKIDQGWSLESTLDVETAHGICQTCNILLVEAKSESFTDLMHAVDRAIAMGAKIISNSYGGPETRTATFVGDPHFNHPGIVFTVSSGDSGYGVSYPASSQFVTAVGGTTLDLNPDSSYHNEDAWTGAGSGCSAYETKLSVQFDKSCKKRTVADVSADADPNTGAAIYTSTPFNGQQGWLKLGGTSLAAPLIAGVYALASDVASNEFANARLYNANTKNFHSVVGGSTGLCGGKYLCTGKRGYDGPTGLGSPNGLGGF